MAFGLFKKKKKETASQYLLLTVKEVINAAKEAVNVVFEKPDEEFDYRPGQFITIISNVNGEKIRRAYSLCTTPFEDEFPAVTVKRVADGRMSNHINDNFKAGDQVEVMVPMGQFSTDYDESVSRKIAFIGGGSGITPLISIIRSLLIKEPKSEAVLIYANRGVEYIIFNELVNSLSEKYEGRFRVIHILEDDDEGIAEITGRLTTDSVGQLIIDNGMTDAEFFICGPQPMMDIVADGLKSIDVPQDAIRMESFEAGKTSPKEIISDSEGDELSQVHILLEGEEYDIEVPMNKGILETALDAGLDMPYSCQSGVCTACRGKCTQGDITTDDAEGLSDEELEEGYRLLCVGQPKTSVIRLEVG